MRAYSNEFILDLVPSIASYHGYHGPHIGLDCFSCIIMKITIEI